MTSAASTYFIGARKDGTSTLKKQLTGFSEFLTSDECMDAKRDTFEDVSQVLTQCRTIINDPPWPFKICWLCGFPVGEEPKDGDHNESTMIESIARRMRLKCYFVNNNSKRYDRYTCEHVLPVKLLGPALLMRKSYDDEYTLNTEEVLDLAHDFCNLIKKNGYNVSLNKMGDGLEVSYAGLVVAKFQINAWPDYLLNGILFGPSQYSVIGISQITGGPIIWFQSSVHVFLFFKLLESKPAEWTELFERYDSKIELPSNANGDYTATFRVMRENVDQYEKDKKAFERSKKTGNPGIEPVDPTRTIRHIQNITEAGDIVTTWKEAIKAAMTTRTETLIDYLHTLDEALGKIILPLLYTASGIPYNYEGKVRTYDELDGILKDKIKSLLSDPKYRNVVKRIAKKTEVYGKGKKEKRLPVAGWPRAAALPEYLLPLIFEINAIKADKTRNLQTLIDLVNKRLKSNNGSTNKVKTQIASLQRKPSVVLFEMIQEKSKECDLAATATTPESTAVLSPDTAEAVAEAVSKSVEAAFTAEESTSEESTAEESTAEESTAEESTAEESTVASSNESEMEETQPNEYSNLMPITKEEKPKIMYRTSSSIFSYKPITGTEVDAAVSNAASSISPTKLNRTVANFSKAVPLVSARKPSASSSSSSTTNRYNANFGNAPSISSSAEVPRTLRRTFINRGNNSNGNNNGNNMNGTQITSKNSTNSTQNMSKRRKINSGTQKSAPREKVFARRTLTTTSTPGGARHKLRNHRNHRTRKQKKNKKTRKNKKLTKRF
jgi:hypothetical protein